MTSSSTLKKIISLGASLLLAVGGSLAAAAPAQASGPLSLTSAPTMSPSTGVTTASSLSSAYGVWANAPIGTGGGADYWRICTGNPSLLSAVDGTDVPSNLNCQIVFTPLSGSNEYTGTSLTMTGISALGTSTNTVTSSDLVGKYIARISIVKLMSGLNTLYGWAFSTASLIGGAPPAQGNPGPTISGTAATGNVLTATTGTWTGSPTSYRYQWVSRTLSNGMCGFSATDISGATSSTYTLRSSDAGSCINVKVWASNANGESSSSNSAWPDIQFMGSGSNNNQNQNQNQLNVCAGQNGITSLTATPTSLTRTDTRRYIWNGDATLNNCTIAATGFASARYLNGTLIGSLYFSPSTSILMTTTPTTWVSTESMAGRQLVPGDVVVYKYWFGLQASPTNQPATYTITFTITGASSVDATDPSVDATDTPITEDKRPLPVWASNIVKSIPTLTKSLNTAGGAVALTDGDFTDLKSVTIGGKAVEFKVETTGNVNIPVPAGQAGKTADIVIVFAGGTMTVQDGIKYVAQTDVATVVERPIAISAGARKLTEAAADQIRQAAFANMTNTTIQCVAYASKNTAAAKSAAMLTAVQACGIATKANPGLKASEITVIVNKAKAKKQAVGIKVYK